MSAAATAAERILAVARQQFLKFGFEKCSMDSVARAARVSKQSLYELYPTKRDLFEKVIRDAGLSARLAIQKVVVNDRPPEDVLCDFLMSFFTGFITDEHQGLFRATLLAGRCFPDLTEELHRYRLTGGEALTNYLAHLNSSGVIRTSDPAELQRRLGSTAVEGTRYLMGTPIPSHKEQQVLARRIATLCLRGYRLEASLPDDAQAVPDAPPPALPNTGASLRLPQQRLDALLDAASAEFLNHGYTAANLTRIVSSVGVSPATVYRQFGNKRGLFQRSVLHLGASLWADDTPAPPTGETLADSLASLAHWTLDRHLDLRSLAFQRMLIIEAEEFPEMARWAYARMLSRPARELHARLQSFGEPAPDAIATRAFFTMATYSIRFIMSAALPDEETRAALSRNCVELFLAGCGR